MAVEPPSATAAAQAARTRSEPVRVADTLKQVAMRRAMTDGRPRCRRARQLIPPGKRDPHRGWAQGLDSSRRLPGTDGPGSSGLCTGRRSTPCPSNRSSLRCAKPGDQVIANYNRCVRAIWTDHRGLHCALNRCPRRVTTSSPAVAPSRSTSGVSRASRGDGAECIMMVPPSLIVEASRRVSRVRVSFRVGQRRQVANVTRVCRVRRAARPAGRARVRQGCCAGSRRCRPGSTSTVR